MDITRPKCSVAVCETAGRCVGSGSHPAVDNGQGQGHPEVPRRDLRQRKGHGRGTGVGSGHTVANKLHRAEQTLWLLVPRRGGVGEGKLCVYALTDY